MFLSLGWCSPHDDADFTSHYNYDFTEHLLFITSIDGQVTFILREVMKAREENKQLHW